MNERKNTQQHARKMDSKKQKQKQKKKKNEQKCESGKTTVHATPQNKKQVAAAQLSNQQMTLENKEPPKHPSSIQHDSSQQNNMQGDRQRLSTKSQKKKKCKHQKALDKVQKQRNIADEQSTRENKPYNQPKPSSHLTKTFWSNKDSSLPTTNYWVNEEEASSQSIATSFNASTIQPENIKSNLVAMKTIERTRESKRPQIGDENKTLSLSDSLLPVSTSSSLSTSARTIHSSALIPVTPNRGFGTRGKAVHVDVNYLPLAFDKLLSTVYQYDVTIEPNLPKRLLPKVFEQYRKTNFREIFIGFDGQKIAVSPKILRIDEKIERQTKVLDENGTERVYKVNVKESQNIKIDFASLKNYTEMRQYDAPLRAIQMLDIVLKSPFLLKNGIQAGRSFYMLPSTRIDLGDNYELWTGLYQSTVLGSIPYLNVDIAHKAFPTEKSIMDILLDWHVNLNKEFDYRTKNDLQHHLKGLMITYTMPGQEASQRTYKFLGFNTNVNTFKFKTEDKKEITIAQYFKSRGYVVKYPLLPTVKLGSSIKNITVPLELCSVAGYQAVNKKCTETQTKNIIKVAATSSDERRKKIMDMLKQIAHSKSLTLNQFGVTVDTEFAQIPARVLSPPELEYKRKIVTPSKGQWRVQTHFLIGKRLSTYAVLIMDKYINDHQVKDFCYLINRLGASVGMTIDNKYATFKLDPFSKTFVYDMYTEMSKMVGKNIELLFCIIPDRGETYGKVKQCAELDCGILTQCIKANTLIRKGTDISTVSNILLKVNVKLNGTNHKICKTSLPLMMKKHFMLIGADVTHPSPGQENIPSVVGIVSSHDVNGFLYNKCWRLQDPKQEIISDFAEILKEHLQFFEKRNKFLPDVILYFRDGVSEGQFQQVLTTELNAMYSGCQQYRPNPIYKPKITFIVVQKRHHTRFFPSAKSDLGGDDHKSNNVPPGTVIDTNITHPNESQFYLVSHQSIQGVARPTKYCLLRDDSNFNIDDLQELTYYLCHFFARCTKSVSYPAPTYYAHLAASRGRVYIEGRNINMNKLDMEFKNRTIKAKIIKDHPMYFV